METQKKTKKNTFEQICLRQEQLKKDTIKTNILKKEICSFPPIGLSIISKIIMNQNNILVSNYLNSLDKIDNCDNINKYNENEESNKLSNKLSDYLKITYCIPKITKSPYQEKTQS